MKLLVAISAMLSSVLAPVATTQSESHIVRDGQYWVRTVSGAVMPPPAGVLRVETVGAIVLRGGAPGRIAYTFKARVKASDQSTAEAMLRQLQVRVGTKSGGVYLLFENGGLALQDAELSLSVPRALRETALATRGGSVQASGLDGELSARSAGGRIEVDDVRGPADVQTGGGDIQIGAVGGALHCFSGGGTIRVQNARGEAWLETAGGEIFVHDAIAPVHAVAAGGNIRIDRAAGPVFASTAGGLIQVQQADGAVTAESSGGAIQVNAANGVECDSTGGAIRLRNVAGVVRASTKAGSILAELLPGRRIQDSTLSTRAGDITVLIPSNFPVTVLARNGSPGTGRIVSDFSEIRVRGTSGQQPGMPAMAEGSLNGGGPVLHINVVGGTIYLRRRQ